MSQTGQDTINKALWAACEVFRGTISADTYKDFILTMLFLKSISDTWLEHDEDYRLVEGRASARSTQLMAKTRFVLPPQAHFATLWQQRHAPGNGKRIDSALKAIVEANGDKLKDAGRHVFQDISFDSDRLGDEKQKNTILAQLLEVFSRPDLDLRPKQAGKLDVIGNAYEYLIKRFAASAGQKAGEFYTPPELSALVAELLEPAPGDTICDPACGSGSLLLQCGRQITRRHQRRDYTLYGQEAIGSTWALAKMNMFLHGEDNHVITWGDTIRNPRLLDDRGDLRKFDVVAANPPFSLDKWGYEDAEADRFNRFWRGIPPKTKGDFAFISHMIETLDPQTGRMAVVVPHGVLFRGAGEGKIRQKLIEENLLAGVIGLPEKLFYSTAIPSAILIFRINKQHDNVLFIDASQQYISGKKQNQLTEEGIARIVNTWRDGVSVGRYASLVSRKEIQDNDYNLNLPRYVDTREAEASVDPLALRQTGETLMQELVALDAEMSMLIRELYGAE